MTLEQDIRTRQLQGLTRRGEGDPNGKVDGPVATIYQQSDGTWGSVLWVKTTALGVLTGWTPFA